VTEFMIARHRVAIAGLVLDGVSGKPIPGAQIEITVKPQAFADKVALLEASSRGQGPGPQSLDTAKTRSDGLFYFLDLPEGRYQVVGFMPKETLYLNHPDPPGGDRKDFFQRKADKRYGKDQFEATVSYAERFSNFAVLRLQPTRITGRVVTSTNQAAVLMAEIRIRGCDERTFSDAQGQFTITGIQPNARKRTLQVRAKGYRDQLVEVLIDKPGACAEVKGIRLVRDGG